MPFETFSLKPNEIALLTKRADKGDDFSASLLASYHEHGESLTKKMYDAFKSGAPLSGPEAAHAKRRAESEGASDFWTSAHHAQTTYGYVSANVAKAVKKDLEETKNRPKIKGIPVRNAMLKDGKPVCADESRCNAFGTEVIGDKAYCPEHGETLRAALTPAEETAGA